MTVGSDRDENVPFGEVERLGHLPRGVHERVGAVDNTLRRTRGASSRQHETGIAAADRNGRRDRPVHRDRLEDRDVRGFSVLELALQHRDAPGHTQMFPPQGPPLFVLQLVAHEYDTADIELFEQALDQRRHDRRCPRHEHPTADGRRQLHHHALP